MNMVRKRSTGIILSYTNTFLNMICGLFLSSFLLRQLGDTDYGVYQTMSAFANYLVLLEFGTGTVLSRNISACRTRGGDKIQIERNISTIWTVTNALSCLILFAAGIFYCFIGQIYAESLTATQIVEGKRIFLFIIVFLLASFYSQTMNGLALGYEHYTFSSVVSIFRLVSRTVLLTVLILNFKNALIIAAVDAVLGIVIAAFSYGYCRRTFHVKINIRQFDRTILQNSLPLCMAMFLQTIITQTNSIVGKFILGVMSGPEDVSLYSIGLYIYSIFSSLATIPVSLYMPQVTKDIISGMEGKELTKTLIQPSRLIVLVSGTVLFGFVACGRQFVDIVYGEAYAMAWVLSLLLIVPSFFNMANAVILNVLDVKNKRIVRSWILMITTVLNIVMTIFGLRAFGIVAVAAATGLATLLQVVIMNIYYQKVIGIKVVYHFVNACKGILVYQILGAAAGYAIGTLLTNVYGSFIAAGCVYVLVSFGGFALFGKNEYEAAVMRNYADKMGRHGRKI